MQVKKVQNRKLKTQAQLKKTKLSKKFLVVISGPTAIGKTAVAIEIAKHFKTEIISADSRQFFKEMSIGTAKPSKAELKKVKHHFIDTHSVKDDLDAGKFEVEAIKKIEKLFEKKDLVLMAGGSGMYVDAVTKGFDPLPEVSELLREELNATYKEKGIEVLQKLLFELDPKHFYVIDLNNPHRLIRALEICIGTGQPYSSFRKGEGKKRDFSIIKIGLNTDREKLYERINKRVDKMMKAGLLDEVKKLKKYRDLNALVTVGYKELFDHLDGNTDLKTAVDKIKQNSRNFAKRQLTWFKKDKETVWFEPKDVKKIIAYIKEQCAN